MRFSWNKRCISRQLLSWVSPKFFYIVLEFGQFICSWNLKQILLWLWRCFELYSLARRCFWRFDRSFLHDIWSEIDAEFWHFLLPTNPCIRHIDWCMLHVSLWLLFWPKSCYLSGLHCFVHSITRRLIVLRLHSATLKRCVLCHLSRWELLLVCWC